jgi:hypothetical protein
MANKEKKVRIVMQHCNCCNFDAHSPTEWINHVETKKHLRKGAKISDNLKCEDCGFVSINSYNFNIHKILIHGTPTDRKTKSKFYCDDCDIGFFCELYYSKHMISKKHLNMVKYNQLINQDKELKLLDEFKKSNDDKLAETKQQMLNV